MRKTLILLGLLTASPTLIATEAPSARIVGGEMAPEGRWPWMTQLAIIVPDSNQYQLCGASQISPRWLLTAAHCMFYADDTPVPADKAFAFIGEIPRDDNPSSGIPIRAIYVHSQYKDLDRDLALLRIDSHNNSAWPSIITDTLFNNLENASSSARDEAVTTLGWGDTGSGSLSRTLQEVQLDYIPQQQCQQMSPLTISEYVVCAAELNPVNRVEQDSCFGDSGGPLFLNRDPSPWLVGLTSFGLNDCATRSPGGYTHLSKEIPELEALSANGKPALTDLSLSWKQNRNRVYRPSDGSISYSLTLKNQSQANTVNSPQLRYTLSGQSSATASWGSCSSLLLNTPCSPVASLASGEQHAEPLSLDSNNGGDQVITITISATANEEDYRQRNNSLSQEVIFSDNPDLVLSASQTNRTINQATVEATLHNRSPLNDASGVQIEFALPTGTTLHNQDELGCSQSNPVRCPLGALASNQQKTLSLVFESPSGSDTRVTLSASADQKDVPDGDTRTSLPLTYAHFLGGGGGGGGSVPLTLLLSLTVLGMVRRARG